MPKAAIISHARWLITGDVMQLSMGIRPEDCFYCFLPLYHGAASLSAGATAIASGASLLLRRKFSRREFWPDVRTHGVTVCQYVGEICRFLLAEPPSPDDRRHGLRKMVGAGLSAEVWEKFVARFGELEIYEGWGATESNTNTINLDNRVGSCGRVPFWEKTNLRLVRYDVDSDSHPRDANGFMMACQAGEVGEAIGMIYNIPDIVAGRFEATPRPRRPSRRSGATCSALATPTGSRAICCAATTMATAGSSTASAIPSAGRAKTSRPWRLPMRWPTCPVWRQ